MKTSANEKGFIKPVLAILVLAFFIYAGFQFGMPHYRHSALKSEAKELARISLGNEDKLKSMLYNAIEEYSVPAKTDDVFVQRRGNKMFVSISWTEDVDILGLYQKELFFEINIQE